MTYIADAACLWMLGEIDVELGSACFADGEVAGFECHGGCMSSFMFKH